MSTMDAKYDFIKSFNINCLMEIMFLATHPDFIKKSIAYNLCYYSIELARELKNSKNIKNKPQIVSSNWTSSYSLKIGNKLGFQNLIETPFTEFSFNGKTFADRIGKLHPSAVLAAKTLD